MGEIGQQAVVAAVPVHDNDLLAAIPRHLVRRLLQQLQLEAATVRDGPRLMLRFEDLTEVVLGKHDGVLLLRRIDRDVAHVDEIVAERQMRAMLLHDAERQEAGALRTRDGILEVCGG